MTINVGIVNLGNRSGDILTVNGQKLRRGEYTTLVLEDLKGADYSVGYSPRRKDPITGLVPPDEYVGQPELLVVDQAKSSGL